MKLKGLIILFAALNGTFSCFSQVKNIYVSPQGNDANNGSINKPFATLPRAQTEARKYHHGVNVYLRKGVYYLSKPLEFTAEDSGSSSYPVVYRAYLKEEAVISGGVKLEKLNWQPYQNGIMQAPVPAGFQTDQLFVNGERQIMARYPNFDPNQLIFNGSATDAISTEHIAKWAEPAGGYIHVMHTALWGDFSYRITGKSADGQLESEGGWQNNRPPKNAAYKFVGDIPGVHKKYRFVENIFEELDAPGEWYLNTQTHTLYFYPPKGLNLKTATIEGVRLKQLVEFSGTGQKPVKYITVKGITFRHSQRTFMQTKEPVMRSDWAIYRGGALFFNGAENCAITDCFLDQLGGNAIFVNNYNRHISITGCHIFKAGANGIVFMGSPEAVRSPLFNYNNRQTFAEIDKTSGPKNNNYPAVCLVDNCLIHQTGSVEKQTAPVTIDLAMDITIRHCSIYDVPRAGINIGDGCWGGNVVEYCDIFNTVKETGDHGSFNSWGRDRWWGLTDIDLNTAIANGNLELPKLDATKPNILRNNRWRCDHGWDIDLDDGSSNYHIYNNLCLNGGIKNREGFYRVVENNIMVNSSFQPHVWYADCGDIVRHNIMWAPYKPAGKFNKPWGSKMDHNFLQNDSLKTPVVAIALQAKSGRDEHSIAGDALFVDAAHGDYRVKQGSPALALGFVNFRMDEFGVQKPELKAIALTPELPRPGQLSKEMLSRTDEIKTWQGARVRNILSRGEMSVYGLPGVTGILVLSADEGSALYKAGLRKDDVILEVNNNVIDNINDLLKPQINFKSGQQFKIKISRAQNDLTLTVN
ncbi:PDZ domain-containing protein [Mucilaginibacter sp. AW1-3]